MAELPEHLKPKQPSDRPSPFADSASLGGAYPDFAKTGGEGDHPSSGGAQDSGDFLKLLFANVPGGYVEITYIAPDGASVRRIREADPEGKTSGIKTVVDWRELPLGKVKPSARITQMNERGYGVYVGIGVRRDCKSGEYRTKTQTGERYYCHYPRGTQRDTQYLTALWADADAKDYNGDLDEARRRIESLNPSIVVFTGGGYQGYLLFDDVLEVTDDNRALIKRTLKGIAQQIGSDTSVAELARVMRLPGTKNTKPGRDGALSTLVSVSPRRFSFEALATQYAPPEVTPQADYRPTVILTGTRAEKHGAATLSGALADYYANPASSGARHTTYVALAMRVIGMIKGGWGGMNDAERQLSSAGDHLAALTGRNTHEARDAMQYAWDNAEAIAQELAEDQPLRIVINGEGSPTGEYDYSKEDLPANLPEGDAYFHPDGDPRSWMLGLCKAFPGQRNMLKFARVWWGGIRQGLIDPLDVTYKPLFAARDALNIPITDAAIRDCVKHSEGLFWNLNWKEKTSSNSQKTPGGRPIDHFRACTLADTEQALPRWADKRIEEARHQERGTVPNLSEQMIDALDGDARRAAEDVIAELPPASEMSRTSAWLAKKHTGELHRSLRDTTPTAIAYDSEDVRAALFAEEITPDEARSFIQIKRQYGMSKGSVSKLVQRAGFAPVMQIANYEVKHAATFEQEVYEARKQLGGYPRAIIETKPNGRQVEHEFHSHEPDINREIAEAAEAHGGRITLVMRTANKYRRLDPAEQPALEKQKTPQTRPVVLREPSEFRPYYGIGYNPTVVKQWLKTHLRRLKWREQNGFFANPATGEKFDLREKSLLEFAESLGAVVMELEPA